MKNISRRKLFSTTAIVGAGFALNACTPTPNNAVTPVVTPGFDLTKAASVVSVIASAAAAELPDIASLFKGGAANTAVKIEGYVNTLGSLAASLASATASAAPSLGAQAIAAFGSIVASLSGVANLPAGLSKFISYAQVLMPVIQLAAGVASAVGVLAPAPSGVSEQQAMAGLIALSQRRAA